MVERIAFFDQTNRNLALFVESARLEPHRIGKMPPQDKVPYLLMQYVFARENSGEEEARPRFWVIENNPEEFLKTAQKLKEDCENDMSFFQADLVKDFFNSLTLVELEAETPSDTVDRETGIRIAKITKGQFAFTTHPTPAS